MEFLEKRPKLKVVKIRKAVLFYSSSQKWTKYSISCLNLYYRFMSGNISVMLSQAKWFPLNSKVISSVLVDLKSNPVPPNDIVLVLATSDFQTFRHLCWWFFEVPSTFVQKLYSWFWILGLNKLQNCNQTSPAFSNYAQYPALQFLPAH